MFVIQGGLVQVSKRVGDEERPIAVLGRGEFLGEMAILNRKPRTATATALEDTPCLVFDGKTLETMIAKNTEIAVRLVKKLASRLDAADTLVEILLHPDPRARVLMGLKRHAEAFGDTVEKGVELHVDAATLAQEVGVERSQVEEVLTRLRRLRIVSPAGTGADAALLVTDVARLHEFLEFLELPARRGERET
jgi:CRP-like cAMP-binding protein